MDDVSSPYRSATALMQDLRAGRTSARELLEAHIARLDALNPRLNAVIATDLGAARRRADEADQARERGEDWGPLHGLPMTIKDAWEVPGMPFTLGMPRWRDHRPARPAPTVQRLLDAGAIVFGKTNVPYLALDAQSYNEVHGVTRNPWDLARTPGGSSGGAAAALAAGLTPLELGSDIGGSIRMPAHFCGVYGHKPTYGIVSLQGHGASEPGTLSQPALCVAGPMARSAEDLRLMLDIIAAPPSGEEAGWRLALPEPRHARLGDFKVLMWMDDPACPIDPRMGAVYQELGRRLQAAGALVEWGAPGGRPLADFYACYTAQMGCLMKAWLTPADRRRFGMVAPFGRATPAMLRALSRVLSLPYRVDRFVDGLGMSQGEWLGLVEEGLRLRHEMGAAFRRHDLILTPPTLTTAFPHDHSLFATRRLAVDGCRRHYGDLFMWIAPATLMGLPATSAPVGRTADGAPVNVQIIGAPYEDRTTLHFAHLMSEAFGGPFGGFQPPPA